METLAPKHKFIAMVCFAENFEVLNDDEIRVTNLKNCHIIGDASIEELIAKIQKTKKEDYAQYQMRVEFMAEISQEFDFSKLDWLMGDQEKTA